MGRPPLYPDDPRTCSGCGVQFARRDGETRPDFNKRKSCSPECLKRITKGSRTHATVAKPCAHCGTPFDREPGQSTYEFNKRKTCSEACRRAFTAIKSQRQMPDRACPVCQQPMTKRYSKTCSWECGVVLRALHQQKVVPEKWCLACGVAIEQRADEKIAWFRVRLTCSKECRYLWSTRARAEPERKSPYAADWTNRLREAIKRRDGYRCVACGDGAGTIAVHHIDYAKQHCEPSNLCSLCLSCHSKTNFNREEWHRRLTALLSHDCSP